MGVGEVFGGWVGVWWRGGVLGEGGCCGVFVVSGVIVASG